MTKCDGAWFKKLAAHERVSLLEPQDGSADDEYRWYLSLKDGWRLSGYGGKGKHFRTLHDVARAIRNAEACEPGQEG
jgi:hypothetical protein